MTVIPVTSTPIRPSRMARKRFQRMSPTLRRGQPSFASPREFSSATSPTPSKVIVMRVHLRHLTSQEWPDGPRSTEEVKSLHLINGELRPHPTSQFVGDAASPDARMTLRARSTATTPGSRAPPSGSSPHAPSARSRHPGTTQDLTTLVSRADGTGAHRLCWTPQGQVVRPSGVSD